jgi:hypothetical protein
MSAEAQSARSNAGVGHHHEAHGKPDGHVDRDGEGRNTEHGGDREKDLDDRWIPNESGDDASAPERLDRVLSREYEEENASE